jgi:hypothetical protein
MNFSIKRVTIIAMGCVAALLVAAGLLIVLMIVFEYPGGIPPSYRATDYDTRLSPIAREAIPIINRLIVIIKRMGNVSGSARTIWRNCKMTLATTWPQPLSPTKSIFGCSGRLPAGRIIHPTNIAVLAGYRESLVGIRP